MAKLMNKLSKQQINPLIGSAGVSAVPMAKATIPNIKIPSVLRSRNLSALSFEPTDKPRKIVTILISAFCAVSLKRSTTPLSFIRLPKQNIPNRGAALGRNNATRISKAINLSRG